MSWHAFTGMYSDLHNLGRKSSSLCSQLCQCLERTTHFSAGKNNENNFKAV